MPHLVFALILIPVGLLLWFINKQKTEDERVKFARSQLAPDQGPAAMKWAPLTDRDDRSRSRRVKRYKDGSARVVVRWPVLAKFSFFGLVILGISFGGFCGLVAEAEGMRAWDGKISSVIALVFALVFALFWVHQWRQATRGGAFFNFQGRVCRLFGAHRWWGGRQGSDIGFHEFAGVQLMARWNEEKNSGSVKRYEPGYTTYQLNLVLKEGLERRYLMAHGNLKAMQADAKILAETLGVPLWVRA